MNKYYENVDLVHLADKVKELYYNTEIVNYIHNGKKIPPKYEKLIERPFLCSNIEGEKSLKHILTNAIRYSFNQTIKLNTSNELRIYRETCERSKLLLSSLQRRKQNGENISEEDIEKKIEEIKLLEKKINEIATQSALKPEINKNILTIAEEVYLLLLRSDKTPCYFYLEVCKKLGHRVNLDQLFPGFRDKDNYKKKPQEDDDDDYKNYMDMNVKKSTYVPPAFRKEDKKDIKVSRVENLMKREEHPLQSSHPLHPLQSEHLEQLTRDERINVLKPASIVPDVSVIPLVVPKKPMGAWGTNKLVITKPETKLDSKPEVLSTVEKDEVTIKSMQVEQDFSKSEWDNDWES
jgi:hypothetical protein